MTAEIEKLNATVAQQSEEIKICHDSRTGWIVGFVMLMAVVGILVVVVVVLIVYYCRPICPLARRTHPDDCKCSNCTGHDLAVT